MPRRIATFEGFVGQRRLVRYATKLVAGFRQLSAPLPPLLFLGPTGHGKTAFAEALSAALATTLHAVFACNKTRPQDLYDELRKVNFGDVFFVDEAQSLGRDAQQSLFNAVDKFKVPAKCESGHDGQGMESIAEFTLVLATNYPGQIQKALRSRAIQLPFEPYRITELKAIALSLASREKIRLSAQAARLIAATAQGTPRLVHQRLKILRLYAPNAVEYTQAIVRECLQCEGIDKYGLTTLQRNYLRTLSTMPNQRSVLDHLAVRLGIDARFIREEAEYFLAEQGYVEVLSNNGRRLTIHGNVLLPNLES